MAQDTPQSPPPAAQPPLSFLRLKQITNDACESTFNSVTSYDHSRVKAWSDNLINTILRSLVSETSKPPSNVPPFKFIVQGTIIQHQTPLSKVEPGSSGSRRGMYSACGAHWCETADGMWSYMYEAGAAKGLDVIISIIWIPIGIPGV
ncbi:MAG: hypothetical protein M1834_004522 [Cirrosporium novae-zelandiae]|nr:MAG: hypothetical protein M1834_004522 [Cirrosporium novae-zelandiae]